MATATTELYLYGVVPAGEAASGPTGVGGGAVRLIDEGGVAALVSDVAPDDLERLDATALAHQDVLASALTAGPVVPFRLGTLIGSDEEVRSFLAERGDAFRGLLHRLDGTVEVGVKAWFDRAAYGAVEEAPSTTGETGRDYLMRRRHERELQRAADRFAVECAGESHGLLAAVAQAAKTNPPQPRELTGRSEEMILNGAYLVPRDDPALRAAVRALERRYGQFHVAYEVTGPWPPYNFVEDGA